MIKRTATLRAENAFPLPDKRSLYCPFTWMPETDSHSDMIIKKIENSLQKMENQQQDRTQWTKFILNLVLSYEYCKLSQFDEALHSQAECERIINYIKLSNHPMFVAKNAFKHVYFSNECFILSEMKQKNSEIMRKITYEKDMNNKERATIWSIGSCFLMEYGPKSSERCLSFVEESVRLDPECAEWHFQLGKVLGRIRREKSLNSIPEDIEMEALQFAVDASNDPWYKVILAQSFMEKARTTHLKSRESKSVATLGQENFESEIKEMNEKSAQLYKNALENNSDNEYVLRKCAKGFNRLPGELKDTNLAKECVFRALQLVPGDALLCHTAALIIREEDADRAKQYFMQAIENGNFSSIYHLLRMKHKENESYDPCADLERYFELFTEDSHRDRLFAWLGAFHYYVRNDFDAALDSWVHILNENSQSTILNEAFVPWKIEHWRIDIGKIIITEINKIIGKSRDDGEEHKKYLEVLKSFEKYRPDIYLKHTGKTSQQDQRPWRTAMPRNTSSESRYEPESNWRRKRPL